MNFRRANTLAPRLLSSILPVWKEEDIKELHESSTLKPQHLSSLAHHPPSPPPSSHPKSLLRTAPQPFPPITFPAPPSFVAGMGRYSDQALHRSRGRCRPEEGGRADGGRGRWG